MTRWAVVVMLVGWACGVGSSGESRAAFTEAARSQSAEMLAAVAPSDLVAAWREALWLERAPRVLVLALGDVDRARRVEAVLAAVHASPTPAMQLRLSVAGVVRDELAPAVVGGFNAARSWFARPLVAANAARSHSGALVLDVEVSGDGQVRAALSSGGFPGATFVVSRVSFDGTRLAGERLGRRLADELGVGPRVLSRFTE